MSSGSGSDGWSCSSEEELHELSSGELSDGSWSSSGDDDGFLSQSGGGDACPPPVSVSRAAPASAGQPVRGSQLGGAQLGTSGLIDAAEQSVRVASDACSGHLGQRRSRDQMAFEWVDHEECRDFEGGLVAECEAGQWDPGLLVRLCASIGAVAEKFPGSDLPSLKAFSVQGQGESLLSTDWVKKGCVVFSTDGSEKRVERKGVSARALKAKKFKLAEAAAEAESDVFLDEVALVLKVEAVADLCEEVEKLEQALAEPVVSAAGFGVWCDATPDKSSATRIPCDHVFTDGDGAVRNTSQLAEGLALVAGVLSADDADHIVLRTDSQYWANWLLSGHKCWFASKGKGKRHSKHCRVKAALALAVMSRSGSVAVIKVKAHCGDTANEEADWLANCGAGRAEADWSVLLVIEWGRVFDVVFGEADVEVNSRGTSKSRECGEMVRGEAMCQAKAQKVRDAVLPLLQQWYPVIKREVEAAAAVSDNAAANKAQEWYTRYTNLLYKESAEVLGTRVFGRQPKHPAQTKGFAAQWSSLGETEKSVKRVAAVIDAGCVSTIDSKDVEMMLDWASVVSGTPKSAVQWKALAVLAQRRCDTERVLLEKKRAADQRAASKLAMYAAAHGRRHKRLKALAFKSKSSEILVSGKVLGQHFAKTSERPPGFVQRVFDFGVSPGFQNDDANRRLRAVPEPAEVSKHCKGKKLSSTPGDDGVPYCVRVELVDELGGVGAAEMDCLFYLFVYKYKFIYSQWHLVIDWPLRKTGKKSYVVPEAYRNISCVDIPRKVLGRVWWGRTCEWLSRCGKYGVVQVSGRKGFPGITYASTLVECMVRVAEHFQLSLIVSFFDLNNFYPRIDVRMIAGAMLWLGMPADVVHLFTMVHHNNSAKLLVAGKLCFQYDIRGIFQGCNTAIQAMIVVSLVWCFALETSGIGVRWPIKELQLGGQVPEQFVSHGVGVSDDLAAAAGGVGSDGKPLHWRQVVKLARRQCTKIFEVYEQFPVPVGADKMVIAGLFYEEGKRVFPTVTIPIYTEKGWSVKNVVPLDEVVQHLGVFQGTCGAVAEAFKAKELECYAEGAAMMADADIPAMGKWNLWCISLLGKRKYLVDKEEQSIGQSAKFAIVSRGLLKKAIGSSVPTAVLHARRGDWGMGLADTEETDLRAKTFAVFALANRQEEWVRYVFLIYLSLTRLVNKIGVAQQGQQSFQFFDWDTSGFGRRKFSWQNKLMHVAVACSKRGFEVKAPSSYADPRIKWCLCAVKDSQHGLIADQEVVGASKCADVFSQWSRAFWAAELKSLKVAGVLARNTGVCAVLSNGWKKRGVVNEATIKFHTKAAAGLLSTPARMKTIGKWESARCPLCGHCWANTKHVLNGCDRIKSRLYSWRHQKVLEEVEKVMKLQWVVISKEKDVNTIWPQAAGVAELVHTRPDLILMDGATEGFLRIVILDVAVAFDEADNLERAACEKIRRYAPLARALCEAAGPGIETTVDVVPFVIGSLGSVSDNCVAVFGTLGVPAKCAKKCAVLASVAAIKASQWIWKMYSGVAFGYKQLYQVHTADE